MRSDSTFSPKPLCLVIGAGFLGSHIIERLLREGYPVRVLAMRRRSALGPLHEKVHWVEGGTDVPDVLKKCMQGVHYLFHFASATLPAKSNLDPVADVHIHLENGLRVILEAARAGVRKVIFPSSGGTVYGIPREVPVSEDHATDPLCSYGIGKLALEKYLAVLERQYGLSYAVLRYSNPFGPGQDPFQNFGAVATFLGRIALEEPIEIWGDGEAVRDFLYIDDAVEATWRAMQYDGSARIFNVGRGSGTSLITLVRRMESATGRKPRVLFRASRSADVPQIYLDISRANRELGWSPMTSLDEGILRTWRWVEEACARRHSDAA